MPSPAFWFVILLSTGQIPAPDESQSQSAALHTEFRRIVDQENRALSALAVQLAKEGQTQASALVEERITPLETSQAMRFRPLDEVVPAKLAPGLANVPLPTKTALPNKAMAIRVSSAKQFFDLAGRAAAPGTHRFSMADRALREVLARDPDHPEARRLLGFLPHKGGWATPHAVDLLMKGYVPHPKFGWVLADWVPHLDGGELPGVFGTNGKPREWLPADDANALRQEWSRAWQIKTAPHFEIQTNVPLDEGVAFARRLEGLYELFFSQFADLIGAEYLPLAERFRNTAQKPSPPRKKFQVAYFAEKLEYVNFFRQQFRQDESISLGYYMPLAEARRWKTTPRAYFYRDQTNPIDSHATLYHEASHQLLFESVKSGVDPNRSNYWIWEGLGTYFETTTVEPDGSILVGGMVGPRLEQAKLLAGQPGGLLPLAKLCAMDKSEFGSLNGEAVYRNYAQAQALVVYLLNGEDGRYREPFLDFVSDAYRGKIRSITLADRLGVPFKTLDEGFLAFLRR